MLDSEYLKLLDTEGLKLLDPEGLKLLDPEGLKLLRHYYDSLKLIHTFPIKECIITSNPQCVTTSDQRGHSLKFLRHLVFPTNQIKGLLISDPQKSVFKLQIFSVQLQTLWSIV